MLGQTSEVGHLSIEIDVFPNRLSGDLGLGSREWLSEKALALGDLVDGVGRGKERHSDRRRPTFVWDQTVIDIAHAEIATASSRSNRTGITAPVGSGVRLVGRLMKRVLVVLGLIEMRNQRDKRFDWQRRIHDKGCIHQGRTVGDP